MNYFKNISQKGITLVEFLIYSVVTAIIVGVLVLTSLNVLEGRAKSLSREEVNHNVRFSMERIMKNIRNADRIESPVVGNTDSYLKLVNADDSIVEFKLNEGNNMIEKRKGGEGNYSPLMVDTVIINELEFLNVSQSEETPGTIKIEIEAEFFNPLGRSEFEFKETFRSTENVRK